jgi:type IV pilus assembly protein PilC
MSFSYEAYNGSGSIVKGVIDSQTELEATEMLRGKGLFVNKIAKVPEKVKKKKSSRKSSKISSKTIAVFARELAVLVSTGTPIVEAIESLQRQTKDETWEGILNDIQTHLESGESFHIALARYPDVFDAVFRSLVAAGESSGHLDVMLKRLAILTRRQAQIRSNLLGAMMYPILLTGISIIVLGVMIGVVLPRFADLFETLDTALPTTTLILMWLSDILRGYWWLVLPIFAAGIFGMVKWITNESGMNFIGNVALRTPQLGGIYRSFNTARVTRLLGVLLEAHVPMLDAIYLTRESMTHRKYTNLLTSAENAVTKGEPISMALSEGELIVPSVCEALRNGEQSGRLAEVLSNVSDYLDEENETVVKSLSSIIEPVIMIVLGIFVGIVAISMFLPLFDLTASAGG